MRNQRLLGSVSALLLLCSGNVIADIRDEKEISTLVMDDAGREIVLLKPAERVVSMSPGLAELIFAIGAGDRLVGTVAYSDYPEAARLVPVIGDYQAIDYESLLLLQPDLVLLWGSGQGAAVSEKLGDLNIPYYVAEMSKIDDVVTTMARLSVLVGVDSLDLQRTFVDQVSAITDQYSSVTAIGKQRVFVQIWHPPLMTVGGNQFISEIVSRCGGTNVFADRSEKSFTVNIESVLTRQPDVILFVSKTRDAEAIAMWKQFGDIPAVEHNRFVWADPDLLSRAGPRIIQGLSTVCEGLH